jgi:hypothetical protein
MLQWMHVVDHLDRTAASTAVLMWYAQYSSGSVKRDWHRNLTQQKYQPLFTEMLIAANSVGCGFKGGGSVVELCSPDSPAISTAARLSRVSAI